MIYAAIDGLLAYARKAALIEPLDEQYTRNRLLELLELPSYQPPEKAWEDGLGLQSLLRCLCGYALERGLMQDSAASFERFEAALMGLLTPWPSVVNKRFWHAYGKSAEAATEYFYTFSQDTNYIRRYHTTMDRRWKTETPYGAFDITINLSKPEKDPRDIAAARLLPQAGYPSCLLCMENEGYGGRADHPARQNHRIIPLTLCGEGWGFQYSPYVYYNEHCIILSQKHTPMVINHGTFEKLLDFLRQFPHYFIGSNADLPIVGGSILSHEHFQGGRYTFAMERANVERPFRIKGYEDVQGGIVNWPMSVLRISGKNGERLIEFAMKLLTAWRTYSDPELDIHARTGDILHNTITPIARMRGNRFEFDLVLRNNRTTEEHPLGLFHPHEELHNIKKENIGLIEVMGLAVLPARLLHEMELLKEVLLRGWDVCAREETAKHGAWVDTWRGSYNRLNADTIEAILQREIGLAFSAVLEHAGVFKRDTEGTAAFVRFLRTQDMEEAYS